MAGLAGAGARGGAADDGSMAAAGGNVAASTPAWRVVLDTNVWLDWLVFDEPALGPLRAAHAAGRVEVVMDAACEAELARVLAYDLGRHSIGAEAQARCLARCREVARRVGERAGAVAHAARDGTGSAAPAPEPALPRCRDPHDQKFLELALAAQADALVTKDQALLELARRKLPFRIVPPQALGAL